MEKDFLRLTDAVYKLLEFFPENEPLGNKIKEKALAIMAGPKAEDVDAILGYLKIAKAKGWIGAMNFLIISAQYEEIKPETAKKQIQKPKTPVLKSEGVQKRDAPSFDISGRKKKIIEFLQKKGKAQVMDLQHTLPQVTKRTIRRDLDDLLLMKKIIREGEFNTVFYKLS